MRDDRVEGVHEKKALVGLGMSFLPYVLLTVIAVGVLTIDSLEQALEAFSCGLPCPEEVATFYGVVNAATDVYSTLALLTHLGAFLPITAGITWLIYGARGYFRTSAATSGNDQVGIFRAEIPRASTWFWPEWSINLAMTRNPMIGTEHAAVAPAYMFASLSNGIGVFFWRIVAFHFRLYTPGGSTV